ATFSYPGFFVSPYEVENCSFQVCEELSWDFDGDCIKSVDSFWNVPCIPTLSKAFIMKIFQICGVQIFELSLDKGLSILLIFSKNQLFVSLIFCIVFFVSILLISALNLIISLHLFLLGDFASSISRAFSFDLIDLSIGWNLPSSAFCRAGFVDRHCLNLVLSWNVLFTPSMVGKFFFNDFVEYVFCAFELVFFSFFYSYYLRGPSVTDSYGLDQVFPGSWPLLKELKIRLRSDFQKKPGFGSLVKDQLSIEKQKPSVSLILSYESEVVDTTAKETSSPITAGSSMTWLLAAAWITDIHQVLAAKTRIMDINMTSDGSTDHRHQQDLLQAARITASSKAASTNIDHGPGQKGVSAVWGKAGLLVV
ncbi:hypothetical protein STEG23_002628, partial [Scotinomys teguina]